MDSRINQKLRLLLTALAMSLILSGCNEYYEQPDYGYNPGYYPDPGYDPGHGGVSDRRMIKNCKLRVENKVSRKLGYDAPIDFGYVDASDISRYQSRIKGDAYVSDRNERLRVDYRCTVDRDNGKVTDVKLDWRNKPGNSGNKNAASTCKSNISRKVQRATNDKVSIDFRKHDSNGMSGNRRRVTGNAHVTSRRGSGKIRYECIVNTRSMQVENSNYQWTQKLPPGKGNGNGNHKVDKNKAKKKCHKAMSNKLKREGYKEINFKSTNFRSAGNSGLIVDGKVKMSARGQHRRARYECRINTRNGNVNSANYQLDNK
jgi:hypothetical protein